jgi:hypothetical protein
VVSFTPIHFIPQYLLDRRLGGPKSWSACCGDENNLILLSGIELHQVEVSGQLHVSLALALGEQPTVLLLIQRQGRLQNQCGCYGEVENPYPYQE